MADQGAKVALVTGSTSGIGLAIANALAKRGVNVIITGFGEPAVIESITNDIKTKYNVRADYLAGDISKVSDIESLWLNVTKLYPDGVDILINNAGLNYIFPIEDFSTEKWDYLIAVLLTAPFHLIKHALPTMKKKGWGRIVNTSSAGGLVGAPLSVAYVAAKHGLIGLTKAVALETASFGITCNAICPGFTQTPMLQRGKERRAEIAGISVEESEKRLLATVPTHHFLQPEQVAELVEFLCLSDASSQMTGAPYLIDHGYTAQ